MHSVTVARAPGIYQYRLLHLGSNRSDLWSQLKSINYTLPDEEQSHGIAQILFLSQANLQTFGKSELITKYVHKDEQNLCDRNVSRSSKQGNAHTYIDRTREATPNGEPNPSFMVCLQQTEGNSVEEFWQYLVERIVRPGSEQDDVMRLRLHLLEPYNQSENSPCVSHEGAQVKNYQAWIELMLRDEAVAKQLLSCDRGASNHVQYIKSIHTFPIVARYTMVYGSKPTVVGLRGYPAVQTIEQAGAENQKTPELLAALYGDVVRGWNQKSNF